MEKDDHNNKDSHEESDDEACYATPPDSFKAKRVAEIFSENTKAKDIKWKAGLIFADKKQLKNAVKSSSMETGRPYNYVVDDLKRVQVGCAKGCPFKIWVTYIEENQSWVRQRALRGVDEKMKEHYANIRRFGGEILRSNLRNTVKIATTRLQEAIHLGLKECKLCRKEGHKINVCPDKPPDYVRKKSTGKRGRQKKAHEMRRNDVEIEVKLQGNEAVTGEASLMDEVLYQMDEKTYAHEAHVQPKVKMKFLSVGALK
ncbi:hypothetical protein AgCh_012432 [Apium graveolens]